MLLFVTLGLMSSKCGLLEAVSTELILQLTVHLSGSVILVVSGVWWRLTLRWRWTAGSTLFICRVRRRTPVISAETAPLNYSELKYTNWKTASTWSVRTHLCPALLKWSI